MVQKVTLVTHITVYGKSTSVPTSPAPNEVRILTWENEMRNRIMIELMRLGEVKQVVF